MYIIRQRISKSEDTKLLIQAVQTISASNKISGKSNVRYFAGNSITLEPGFEVSPESVFTAKVQIPCINTANNLTEEVKILEHLIIDE